MREKSESAQKFASFVVKFRWLFVAVFLALIIFSAIMLPKTEVVYDLSTYVPKGSLTQKSIALLKDQFDDKGSLNVMVAGVTPEQAQTVYGELAAIEGVVLVVFDASANYINGEALYTVSLSDYDSTDGANAAIERILAYLSDKEAYITGQSASTYYTRRATEEAIMKIAGIIAAMIVVILLFTSKTFFEIVLMIVVFGAAILLNLGTNFILGGISYISNLIGMVLQLVLTIDYFVILLHRFLDERRLHSPAESAVLALKKGIPEIFSGALTTVAGMVALMLMTLPLGPELGIVLTKGIVFSMVTVIFLMPALLVFFSKPIERSAHKTFVPNVAKPVKKMLSARRVVACVFLVIAAAAFTGQFFNEYSFNINGSIQIVAARERVSQNFGTMNTLVVMVPRGDYQKEREISRYMLDNPLIDEATGLALISLPDSDIGLTDKVTAEEFGQIAQDLGFTEIAQDMGLQWDENFINILFSYYRQEKDAQNTQPLAEYKIALIDLFEFIYGEINLPDEIKSQLWQLVFARANFESENYSRILFNINASVESEQALALVGEITEGLKQFGEFYVAGESVVIYEMSGAFPADNLKVVLFTMGFIMLILFATFRNLTLPFILLLTIQGGVWINFCIPFLAGSPIMFIGYLVISAIQMGATIDYAIILTNRYMTTKANFLSRIDAMGEAENSVFSTIITSGLILTLAGYIMGFATNEPVISGMGMLLGTGALMSMLMVLFALPPLLLVCHKLIDKTELKFIAQKIRAAALAAKIKRPKVKGEKTGEQKGLGGLAVKPEPVKTKKTK